MLTLFEVPITNLIFHSSPIGPLLFYHLSTVYIMPRSSRLFKRVSRDAFQLTSCVPPATLLDLAPIPGIFEELEHSTISAVIDSVVPMEDTISDPGLPSFFSVDLGDLDSPVVPQATTSNQFTGDSSDATEEDDSELFVVKKILDHKYVDEKLFFLVHWQGYNRKSDHTWEPESGLTNCYDPVQQYCLRKGLVTSLKPLGGAVIEPETEVNLSNWVGVDDVIRCIHYYIKQPSYCTDLEVLGVVSANEKLSRLQKSALYVILHHSHFFVVLYDHSSRIGYVCDSVNWILEKGPSASRFAIRSYFPAKLQPLVFGRALGVDHCGAGAAVIALELLRLYKRRDLSRGRVDVPAGMMKRMIGCLHKEPSQPVKKWLPINQLSRPTCLSCGYVAKTRKALLLHERAHK